MLTLVHAIGARAPSATVGTGLSFPVEGTAIGNAWLWAQPTAIQSEWLARLRSTSSMPVKNPHIAAIYQAFHDLEITGVSHSLHDSRSGITMAATPIVLREGQVAVLACLCSGDQVSDPHVNDECLLAMRETAEELRASTLRIRNHRSL